MTREEALEVLEIVRAEVRGPNDDGDPELGYSDLWCWIRKLSDAGEVLAQPVPRNSRWVVLPFNSGSGKTLFRCGVCGRLSNTPDKRCPDKWGCDRYTGVPGLNNPAPDDFR